VPVAVGLARRAAKLKMLLVVMREAVMREAVMRETAGDVPEKMLLRRILN
jgi:hypothetical protein